MSARGDQEEDVVPSGILALVLAATLAFAGLLVLFAWLDLRAREKELGVHARDAEPAQPRTVSGVRQQLFDGPAEAPAMAAEQRALLDSYGWVDRKKNLVRIPIERAIELVGQKP